MIYTVGWDGFRNYRNLSNSRNTNSNLDKPSYPKKIRLIIPGLITDLKEKSEKLLQVYPWLNSSSTSYEILEDEIVYTNAKYGSKRFGFIDLGRFDLECNIWSWSWVDNDNKYIIDAKSMIFRDYGSNKDIEVLTKANWYTTNEEKIEVVALCSRLVVSKGLEIQVEGNIERYYLLLDLFN